jgi:hypothetical protein
MTREAFVARVPITVMGFRCERCAHEWIPRGGVEDEPKVCPSCKSPYWSKPRKSATTYEDFSSAIAKVLREAGDALTWTEVRTLAKLPQAFPNNKWVRKMETDIGLARTRDEHGIIHWRMVAKNDLFQTDASPTQTSVPKAARTPRK